jgi:hypothetical protein
VNSLQKPQTKVKTYTAQSASEPGKEYTVTVFDEGEGIYTCSCPGYTFRRECHHGRDVLTRLGDLPLLTAIELAEKSQKPELQPRNQCVFDQWTDAQRQQARDVWAKTNRNAHIGPLTGGR